MLNIIKARLNLDPLRDASPRVAEWFATPLGRRLLIQERKAVADELKYLFGYHFMQLSSVKAANFASSSRINHSISFAPGSDEALREDSHINGCADFDRLPLQDESVDVTVLHHVLEFSENPHQVLKEAARVTIPRGYLIIVAFNPLSLSGIFQPLAALFNVSGISRRRALRTARMRDWLEFLDFSCTNTRHVYHNLPFNNSRFQSSSGFLDKFNVMNRVPMGMSFVMVARKDKVGLRPIKPTWDKSSILGAIPIAKPAIRTQANKECLVLPFKSRIKKEF